MTVQWTVDIDIWTMAVQGRSCNYYKAVREQKMDEREKINGRLICCVMMDRLYLLDDDGGDDGLHKAPPQLHIWGSSPPLSTFGWSEALSEDKGPRPRFRV